MRVPSIDIWPREEFLSARRKQMERQKKIDLQGWIEDQIHPKTYTYIDPGDRIVCDSCNIEIDDEHIILVEYGRRVACDKCFYQWYAHMIPRYRTLRSDGTLGPEEI